MKPVVSIAVCMLVLAFAGSSVVASAQTRTVRPQSASNIGEIAGLAPLVKPVGDSYISNDTTSFSKPQSKVYQFNLQGKWGVKFDVNQPETSPAGANDIDAGAYYRLTPSLRVGGTLGFGEKTDNLKPEATRNATQGNKSQPRVRLETTFSF
ncbi:MAG: NtrZ family periplasmic regulatory protein [Asticcacaulis sp.]